MRALSVGWELEINLTDEEIALLETQSLRGKIRVWEVGREKEYGNKLLEVGVGEIDQRQLDVELRTFPRGYIDRVERYRVVIATEAYPTLVSQGCIGDRMAFNPACKVFVQRETRPTNSY